MSELSSAIKQLAEVAGGQLRRDRARDARERAVDPEFQAAMAARRRPPRPLSAKAFAPMYAHLFTNFVPDEFYCQVDDGTLVVSCPCGEEHVVEDRGFPHGGSCGRHFLFDGERMRVVRLDADEGVPTDS